MNKIFEAIVGSQSYGTNVEGSDIDKKSVYMASIDELLGFNYQKQIENNKDDTSYEVKRFLELLSTANPTVLELLYSPEDCILLETPQWKLIKDNRHKFLTKKCKDSFGGYAVQQIKKAKGLDKKLNWEKSKTERKTVLDFCYFIQTYGKSIPIKEYFILTNSDNSQYGLVNIPHTKGCYGLFRDTLHKVGLKGIVSDEETANDICLSSIPKKEAGLVEDCGVIFFNKEAYSSHCKDYNDYQSWLKTRNTQRYIDIENHSQQIDGKNLLHCRRLIDTALEIPVLNTIQVRRPNTEYLKSIRQGKVDLDAIILEAEKDIQKLDELYSNSNLPDEVDQDFVNNLLIQIRKHV